MHRKETEIPAEFESWNIPKFKYASVTSVNIERSFWAFRLVLGEKRPSLSHKILQKLL
jgi:hypothetical protein